MALLADCQFESLHRDLTFLFSVFPSFPSLLACWWKKKNSTTRLWAANTVAVYWRKTYIKDQGSPHRPGQPGKAVPGQLHCPRLIRHRFLFQLKSAWKEVRFPQMQAANRSKHNTCIYMETNMSRLLGALEWMVWKGWWSLQAGCRMLYCWLHLPGSC